MQNYCYDLHIHSCLSPCAEDDMTPANIAGMGSLCGLTLMALTDHNTTGNLPAFFDACKVHGIVPVGGMELTTSEEIHIICLFDTLKAAMDFGEEVYAHLPPMKNKPEIFGNQLYMDSQDNILRTEEKLLLMASDLSLDEAEELVGKYGGICYPAHIDRESNGILAILGTIPPESEFTCFELNDRNNLDGCAEKCPLITGMEMLTCSDAHRLWEINEAEHAVALDDEPYSSQRVREALLEHLRGNKA